MKYLCISALSLAVLAGCKGEYQTEPPTAPVTAPETAPESTATADPGIWKEGYYSFDGMPEEKVHYLDKDGLALFQGDIVLHGMDAKKNAAGLVHPTVSTWNNQGILAYDLQSLPSTLQTNWLAAISHLSRRTDIRFSRDRYLYPNSQGWVDYVKVIQNASSTGGYSSVGRVGGIQNLGLGTSVGAATIVHELLHALGHWHEQSRADRDTFVRVNTQNIDAEHLHNFDMHSSNGLMMGGYDYCSVMHYPRTAFSTNGQDTLTQLQAFSCQVVGTDNQTRTYTTIGQRGGISDGDIQAVAARYPGIPSRRPFAFAGFDKTVYSESKTATRISFTLSASRSFALDGTALTYRWTAMPVWNCAPTHPGACTPNTVIASPNSASTTVTQPISLEQQNWWEPYPRISEYPYRLTVTDSAGRTMSDVVTVTVRAR